MRGFEELSKLDPVEVAQKTRISVDAFKAIVDKRFDAFSKTKAIGFINILEREYDLDLQDWLDEFEVFKMENADDRDIFIIAPKESESLWENKLFITVTLGIIALFIVLFALYPDQQQDTSVEENESYIVAEAQQGSSEESTPEAQTETMSLPQKEEEQQEITPPVKKDTFYLESNVKLWVGIKYLDNNEQINTIFKDHYELDPNREQRITFGHGYFKLVFNDQVIEPRERNVFKITYKNGHLDVYKVPLPKKPEPSAQEGETSESNTSENSGQSETE